MLLGSKKLNLPYKGFSSFYLGFFVILEKDKGHFNLLVYIKY